MMMAAAQPETHLFTESNGKTYPAEVISVKNGEVVVKRADGKAYSLEVQSLFAADQDSVRAWKPVGDGISDATATTESDIAVKITVEPVPVSASNTQGPFSIAPKVNLLNRETRVNFKGLKGTLILIAQQPNANGRFKVIAVQTFSADLAAGGQHDFNGAAVANSVKSLTQGSPDFHYVGYLFILQNADNNIIQFEHSGGFGKSAADALKLKIGDTFPSRRSLGRTPARSGARAVPSALPLGG